MEVMADKKIREYVENTNGTIKVGVSGFANGYKSYKNVNLIRIKSKKYSLLIMADYMPVIGEIEGDVDIISKRDLVELHDIKGVFTHRNNMFSLVLNDNERKESA